MFQHTGYLNDKIMKFDKYRLITYYMLIRVQKIVVNYNKLTLNYIKYIIR
jgi:hypothetical protein